jgi:hypothetical protein
MTLASRLTPILEIPLPLLFSLSKSLLINDTILLSAAKAARNTGTMLFVRPEDFTEALIPYADHLIPCLTAGPDRDTSALVENCRAVELTYSTDIESRMTAMRALRPDSVVMVGMPLDARAADHALQLARTDVDSLHFYADDQGNESGTDQPRFLKEMIREIHLKLVAHALREKVNLVFSGGIAMAEHMAKAIICGADGITVDHALLIAMECRLCYRCRQGLSCPVKLDADFDSDWGSRRITNLIGAWHNQLLEVMGAMGIREARRLRGEVGRSMWFEDLEREHFGPIFGERKVAGLG